MTASGLDATPLGSIALIGGGPGDVALLTLRGVERMLEVLVDALEVGDDRAAERRDAVEDEEL